MKASINGSASQDLDDTVAYCPRLDAASQASGRIRAAAAVASASVAYAARRLLTWAAFFGGIAAHCCYRRNPAQWLGRPAFHCCDNSARRVGAARTPWDALRIEELALRGFTVSTNCYRTRYRVDRMTLATASGSVVLDPIAIEQGQAIVDTIWRRLVA